MTSPLEGALRAAAGEGLEPNARRWAHFAGWRPGDHIEVQALNLGGRQFYAHAPDPDVLVHLLRQVDANPTRAEGVYVIANRVSDEVAHREPPGEWHLALRGSTADKDITHRTALYVDVDVVRPTRTSSTDAELGAACEVATRIYTDLAALVGYAPLAAGLSGNGLALFVALDRIPESPELKGLVADVLRALQALYQAGPVKLDAQLCDAKRLVPAFGTVKAKGPAGDPERPHRRTALLAPEAVHRLGAGELRHLRDLLVARAPAPPPPPLRPAPPPPSPTTSLEIDELRKRLVGLRRAKASSDAPDDAERYRIYSAMLDGEPLALSPTEDANRAALPLEHRGLPAGRAKAMNRAASMLAFALPVGTAWECAVELLRPAVAATDCDPEGVDHWLQMAEQSYERAMDRALQSAREAEERRRNEELTREALAQVAPPPAPPAATSGLMGALAALGGIAAVAGAPAVTPAPDAAYAQPATGGTSASDWTRHFIRSADLKVTSCPHNAYVFLAHHPAVAGTVRFNLVKKDIEVAGGPFASMDPDTLSTAVMNSLHASEWRIKVKRTEVEDQLLLVAMERKYDPIATKLRGLVWDKVPRIDRFFFDFAVARTKGERGADLTQHLQRIGSKFCISAVARALSPGCQVDTMVVLEGIKEGEGKTELCRRLFKPWYAVTRGVNDKDALMLTATTWGIELGELSAAKRSEDEHWKSVVDTREDTFRLPYGRRLGTFPRRCVFIGTTNNPRWLTPGKGRRRYWPAFIEQVHLDLVDEFKDQLWAEAVVRYDQKERWHLLPAERDEADTEVDARVEESFIESKIGSWWYGMRAESRPKFVTLLDVVETALRLERGEALRTKSSQADINYAMARLGFTKGRQTTGARLHGWTPSEDLLAAKVVSSFAPAQTPEDGLDAVASARPDRVV